MKTLIFTLFFALCVSIFQETNAATDKVVCYYGSWATYRHGKGTFDVENIDPRYCTHLIYTFVGLLPDGTVRVLDEYNDLEENWGKGAFKRFNNLRKQSPGTKTLIAIGGWNEGSETYSKVMANDNTRRNFVKNALAFVRKYGFDGFDLDWEYPNQRGGAHHDIENFSKLLKEMREAFQPHGLLLTAAVAAAEFSVAQSYDVPALSKYLDFINVMTYDLHGPWDKKTGQNAPLYPSSKDVTELEKNLNVVACINTWIRRGADPAKIIMGMGTYGRTFTLNDPEEHGLNAPANNAGNGGPYTNEAGMIGYNEIVELQGQGGWTVVWDEEQQVPYMYKGNQWVGYDNPRSIKIKTNYAKKMGLGGAMIWSVETDDFHGLSGTKFAILQAINSALGNQVDPEPPTTESPSTSENTGPTEGPTSSTTTGPSDGICRAEGYIRDPENCAKFYYCIPLLEGGFKQVEFKCSEGLVFDPNTLTCNYPWNVTC